MAKTSYVVLEEVAGDPDGPIYWSVCGNIVEATSAAGAIRLALKDQDNLHALYVAVPLRSWQPQSVKVETQQRIKIG